MSDCFFVSDLHGSFTRCEKLFELLQDKPPTALFIGGDILPSGFGLAQDSELGDREFLSDYLFGKFASLKEKLSEDYPKVLVILGNDDPATYEKEIEEGVEKGHWEYIHNRKTLLNNTPVYGYSYIPPSPFQLKDWEKYDVSRYVDVGAVSPEEGIRTAGCEVSNPRYETIAKDLKQLTGSNDLNHAIFLFHSPPYETKLDRAALDGKMVDHAHIDVHVGSIAIRRLIEKRQPLLTLHGHIHESAKLTGSWRDKIDKTHMFNAAHNGPELSVIIFDLDDLDNAKRILL